MSKERVAVEVRAAAKAFRGANAVLAECKIKEGERIFILQGELADLPTKYSIQIGEAQHLEPHTDREDPRALVRFLNHSCDPTARIDFTELCLYARRALDPGEEINFNYNTSEYEMFSPFMCNCGSIACAGHIRGYRYLSLNERARLDSLVAPHLRALEKADNER